MKILLIANKQNQRNASERECFAENILLREAN